MCSNSQRFRKLSLIFVFYQRINSFQVLFITFLLTLSWFGIACFTFIPLYGLFYVYFVVCNNRYGTAGGSFVNSKSLKSQSRLETDSSQSIFHFLVLNEINQHAHPNNDKPSAFKLSDICQPVSIIKVESLSFCFQYICIHIDSVCANKRPT